MSVEDKTMMVVLRTWHADSAGFKASKDIIDKKMIGSRWFHLKSGVIYVVTGFGYDSQRERWMISYQREVRDDRDDGTTDFPFHHLPEDFHSEGRFLRVNS